MPDPIHPRLQSNELARAKRRAPDDDNPQASKRPRTHMTVSDVLVFELASQADSRTLRELRPISRLFHAAANHTMRVSAKSSAEVALERLRTPVLQPPALIMGASLLQQTHVLENMCRKTNNALPSHDVSEVWTPLQAILQRPLSWGDDAAEIRAAAAVTLSALEPWLRRTRADEFRRSYIPSALHDDSAKVRVAGAVAARNLAHTPRQMSAEMTRNYLSIALGSGEVDVLTTALEGLVAMVSKKARLTYEDLWSVAQLHRHVSRQVCTAAEKALTTVVKSASPDMLHELFARGVERLTGTTGDGLEQENWVVLMGAFVPKIATAHADDLATFIASPGTLVAFATDRGKHHAARTIPRVFAALDAHQLVAALHETMKAAHARDLNLSAGALEALKVWAVTIGRSEIVMKALQRFVQSGASLDLETLAVLAPALNHQTAEKVWNELWSRRRIFPAFIQGLVDLARVVQNGQSKSFLRLAREHLSLAIEAVEYDDVEPLTYTKQLHTFAEVVGRPQVLEAVERHAQKLARTAASGTPHGDGSLAWLKAHRAFAAGTGILDTLHAALLKRASQHVVDGARWPESDLVEVLGEDSAFLHEAWFIAQAAATISQAHLSLGAPRFELRTQSIRTLTALARRLDPRTLARVYNEAPDVVKLCIAASGVALSETKQIEIAAAASRISEDRDSTMFLLAIRALSQVAQSVPPGQLATVFKRAHDHAQGGD